jgi:phosphoribosylaminoimidazolecarboxamide formyltransferase/IMP cyclohydrolase
LGGEFVQSLRYGENPAQKAAWFRTRGAKSGLHQAQILQGKELSYNNLLDLESATSTVREFRDVAACVAVKHNSPCGVGTDVAPDIALQKALSADPQSVFGGIIAVNFNLTEEMADPLNALFLECVIAPSVDKKAREQFAKKKNLRVLTWDAMMTAEPELLYRSLSGGFLVQTRDQVKSQWDETWQVLGQKPSAAQKQDLLMAWKTCAHLKSNAISIVSQGVTVGLGMGQVNRVDAVAQAIERMQRFHTKAQDPVLASDAFFPFPDSIEKIASAGIRWIIQPGGSVKDPEVIKRASELGVTLVLTGQRHFLH